VLPNPLLLSFLSIAKVSTIACVIPQSIQSNSLFSQYQGGRTSRCGTLLGVGLLEHISLNVLFHVVLVCTTCNTRVGGLRRKQLALAKSAL